MGRFNSKKTAERLKRDILNMNLAENIRQLIGKMNRGLTEEQREQYREVYKNDPNALDNLEQKQNTQKRYLAAIQTALDNINTALDGYIRSDSYKRDQKSVNQQRFWDEIFSNYQELSRALENYKQNGNNFPVSDDMVICSANIFAKALKKDFLFPKNGNLEKSQIGSNIHYRIAKAKKATEIHYPLFPHNPDPMDLTQGDMGDCFMHSSLYSIANTAPKAIRDAMVDNEDGTVTVRFYGSEKKNGSLKPVYVTVPKVKAPNGNTGSMWTYMMEQAFALSGLGVHPQGVIKKDTDVVTIDTANGLLRAFGFSRNKNVTWGQIRQKGPSTGFDELIQPGSAAFFTKMLLGPNVSAKQFQLVEHQPTPMLDDKGREIKFTVVSEKKEQLKIFRDTLKNGDVISCGIQNNKVDEVNGISTLHAYTIVSIDDHENITLMNPHNGQGREGQFTMSYDEFKDTFTEFSVAEIPPEYKFKEPSKVQENYRDIVENITNALDAQNKWYHILFQKNSPEFKRLSESLATLSASLRSENVDEREIKEQMRDVVNKATAYENQAERNKSSSRYRENRLSIAKAIKALGEIMAEDPQKDPHGKFNSMMKEQAAEKIAKGFNEKFGDRISGHETTKEQFMDMPLFQKMVDSQDKTYDLAFRNTTSDMMEKMQKELHKVNQDVTVEKQLGLEAQHVNENQGLNMN